MHCLYTVIVAFALAASVIVIIIEFIHFSCLWEHNPTEISDETGSQIHPFNNQATIRKTHRRHLRFIDYSLLNDQNDDGFRRSLCEFGHNCRSRSLDHHLCYHSLDAERERDSELADESLRKSFIAFHRTTAKQACTIVQKECPPCSNTAGLLKEYLHLGKTKGGLWTSIGALQ